MGELKASNTVPNSKFTSSFVKSLSVSPRTSHDQKNFQLKRTRESERKLESTEMNELDEKSFSTTSRKRKREETPIYQAITVNTPPIRWKLHKASYNPLVPLLLLPTPHCYRDEERSRVFWTERVEQTKSRTKFPKENSCAEELKNNSRSLSKSTQEGRINFSELEVDWLHYWLIIRMNSAVRF